ncbi:MAG: hypothetical protein EOP53_21405 [Sphingobacteriales bacterium]|nr:MAG: hypothetical protein EOP53_21405 [Sphingobacteriales bacterium]
MEKQSRLFKTITKHFLVIAYMAILSTIFTNQAAAQSKTSIGVIAIETNGVAQSPIQIGNLVRLELEKINQFMVIDKYDIYGTLKQANINADSCNGKKCLVQAGGLLKADKMLTGSVERFGNKVVIALRLIDVKHDIIEKTEIDEYRDLQDNLQEMLRVSIQKLVGIAPDASLEQSLTKTDNFENTINNPGAERLICSGPRIGLSVVLGDAGKRITADRENGGWEGYPVMTIFGYQKEIQYLNEGNFQALLELIPVVAGLDQNLFNPSISILNGFRSNKDGWEFALGPQFSLAPMARGYYEGDKWVFLGNKKAPENVKVENRLDNRGTMEFRSSFVFAVGKSFRSGKMNIPLNLYVIPGRDGWRMGLAFGFNAKRREM